MDSLLLSIIIPIYNQENYIIKCLNSIQKQIKKDTPVEILIIDDGSIDGSKEKIRSFLEDFHFHYVYQDNQGVSAARNHGIKLSKGKYITFVDSDDYLNDNYISNILKNLNNDTELLCFNFKEFSDTVKEYTSLHLKNEKVLVNPGDGLKGYLQFRYQEWIRPYVWNKIYKRKTIVENDLVFDTNKKIGEDTLFNAAYIEYVQSIDTISDDLYYHLVHSDSAIHRYHSDFVKESIQYYDSFIKIAKSVGYNLNMHDLEAFYISRWFGCINNEAKSDSISDGWYNLKMFLNHSSFINNRKSIRFYSLPNKIKVYYLLMSFKMTYPIFRIMYFIQHKKEN